jgi:hypothetical protein
MTTLPNGHLVLEVTTVTRKPAKRRGIRGCGGGFSLVGASSRSRSITKRGNVNFCELVGGSPTATGDRVRLFA